MSPWMLRRPLEVLVHAQRRLSENTYDVLVVGEAKRSKNAFVYALIDRNILPTSRILRSGECEQCRELKIHNFLVSYQ
jgi:hypothetical protein